MLPGASVKVVRPSDDFNHESQQSQGLSTDANPNFVLRAIRRGWLVLTVSSLAGLTLGLFIALEEAPTYTAEVRVGVGAQDLASQSVPGFVASLGSLTSTYARFVNNSSENIAAITQEADVQPGVVASIAASPIPESGVLRIEVSAFDPFAAKKVATIVANQLRSAVASSGSTLKESETLLNSRADNAARAAARQELAQYSLNQAEQRRAPSARLSELRSDLTSAMAAAAIAQAEQQAAISKYQNLFVNSGSTGVFVIRPATITGNNSVTIAQQDSLLGLIAGFLGGFLACMISHLFHRRRRR